MASVADVPVTARPFSQRADLQHQPESDQLGPKVLSKQLPTTRRHFGPAAPGSGSAVIAVSALIQRDARIVRL
jgi:hypothetical protein